MISRTMNNRITHADKGDNRESIECRREALRRGSIYSPIHSILIKNTFRGTQKVFRIKILMDAALLAGRATLHIKGFRDRDVPRGSLASPKKPRA